MKNSEVKLLKAGEIINHSQFRKVQVIELVFSFGELFGVKVLPIYWRDRTKLSQLTGMHPNTPMLETTYKFLSN